MTETVFVRRPADADDAVKVTLTSLARCGLDCESSFTPEYTRQRMVPLAPVPSPSTHPAAYKPRKQKRQSKYELVTK